jgi:hypothetical protein
MTYSSVYLVSTKKKIYLIQFIKNCFVYGGSFDILHFTFLDELNKVHSAVTCFLLNSLNIKYDKQSLVPYLITSDLILPNVIWKLNITLMRS